MASKLSSIPWEKIDRIKMPIKLAVLGGTVLLIGLIFFFGFYRSTSSNYAKLSKDKVNLNKEISTLNSQLARKDELKAEFEKTEKEFDYIKEYLPKQVDIPTLLGQLSEKISESGLRQLRFDPQKETIKDFYAENRIALKLDGTFMSLAEFFDKVRLMERIVSVADFRIVGPLSKEVGRKGAVASSGALFRKGDPSEEEPGLEGDRLTLIAECEAITYRLLTEKELEEAQAKRESEQKKKSRKK